MKEDKLYFTFLRSHAPAFIDASAAGVCLRCKKKKTKIEERE